jgi:hypothetical protein
MGIIEAEKPSALHQPAETYNTSKNVVECV